MAAAICDYVPSKPSSEKIKSKKSKMSIEFDSTMDIIKSVREHSNALIVAFALETSNGEKNALNKMEDKGADFIILNHPDQDGCGINSNFNKVTIFDKNQNQIELSKDRKDRIAKKIIEYILIK